VTAEDSAIVVSWTPSDQYSSIDLCVSGTRGISIRRTVAVNI